MFETDRIPAGWVRACNAMDEVWVPTRFNVETFASCGVHRARLVVVPSPIAIADYDCRVRPLELPGPRRFTFLSVFDWSWRKGWDVLLRAFCSEFRRDHDDVRLVLKVHSPHAAQQPHLTALVRSFVRRRLHASPRQVPPILMMTRVLSSRQMPRLYKSADCFVLPSRGEGWGRPLMEAMAMGLPAIAARWSGHLEFMNDRNAYLCDVDRLVVVPPSAVREAPAFRGHRWAEPSVDDLRRLMRHVYERPDVAHDKGKRGRADMVRLYDARIVCRRVADRLREIAR